MKYRILLFVSLLGLLSSCGGDDETQMEESQAVSTTISEITNITDFEAQVNVLMENGTSNTITERGVVYGLENNPTVDDTKIIDTSSQNTFSVNLTGLTSANQYFVRSFFIVGGDVSYSGGSEFITTDSCSENVFTGDVRLETQAELEAFGAMGYCKIDGTLRIGTILNDNDRISNLSSLSSIREVQNLLIVNTLISNLDDIEITSLGRLLSVMENENLTNINKLNNISFVALGQLIISENPILTSIDGLVNVNSLGSTSFGDPELLIRDNDLLENLDGLQNLISIGGLGSVFIDGNQNLTNIDALSSMENVTSDFGISINISNNDSLENIDGISSITDCFSINIENNDALISVEGINGIESSFSFYLINNDSLNSLQTNIPIGEGAALVITNNNNLLDINGLESASKLFSARISGNNSLISLDGLNNLVEIEFEFEVRNNSNLNDFCSITNLITSGGLLGNYIVNDNAYNPTQQDIIDGNCSI